MSAMQRNIRLSAALLCLGLCACQNLDLKETLGLNHRGPDAFQVYSRPPLTVPPEFSLQAPGKGPENSIGVPAEVQAHNNILSTSDTAATGTGAPAATPTVNLLNSPTAGPAATAVPVVTSNPLPSTGDAQFLANVGASKADPNVREEIEKDKQTPVATKDDHYLFGGQSTSDPVVDSTKEADRLKQDKAQDKPPTTGETPVIAPQNKGILGDIF